jgi:hypothetical protein
LEASKKRNIVCPCQNSSPEPSSHSQFTILPTLSRLLQGRPTYNFLRDRPVKSTNHDFPLYVPYILDCNPHSFTVSEG